MNYTASELTVIIAAIGAMAVGVLTGLGGVIVSVITAWQVKKTKQGIEEVHVLVNERSTLQDKELKELRSTVSVLIEALSKRDTQDAVLDDRMAQQASLAQGAIDERERAASQEEVIKEVGVVGEKVDDVKVEVDKIPKTKGKP